MEEKKAIVTCTCPSCSQKIKVKHPGKAGKFKYTCTNCKTAFVVSFKDNTNTEPPQSTAGEAPTKELTKKELANTQNKPAPEPEQNIARTPPKDKAAYMTIGGLLEHHKGFFGKDKLHPLKEGSQLVGRESSQNPSDISFDDSTMSRQSIEIIVEANKDLGGTWYSYILNVKKTKNPVTLNGSPLSVGESVVLEINDTIVIGKTKLTLK